MHRRLPTAVFAAALALLGLARPAPAQPVATPSLMRVASISPWTDRTHDFATTLQVSNPTELNLERVSLRLTVYGRVFSRSQLRAALEGRQQTGVLGGTTARIADSIEPGQVQAFSLDRPVGELVPGLRSTGVYPVALTVVHTRGEETAYTALPYFASAPENPLNVSWVLPVSRRVVAAPGGVYPADAIEALDLDGLTQRVAVLDAKASLPVTLAPSPSLLDTLADLADGFEVAGPNGTVASDAESLDARTASALLSRLRHIAATVGEVATVPYAPADLPSLASQGLRGDLLRQVTLGRAVVADRLGRPPSLAVLDPPGLSIDQRTALALGPLGTIGFLADPSVLARQPTTPFQPNLFGPSRPVALAGASGGRAMLADAAIRARFDGPEQGVLLAQALIAETASAWLEMPLLAAQRVMLMTSRDLPSPPALAAALNGFASAPWLRMLPAGVALSSLPPQGPPLPTVRLGRIPRGALGAAANARRALDALGEILAEPLPDADALDRLVLRAESSDWIADDATGRALAASASARARGILSGLRVAERRVTLTSRTGSIPVTVVNETGLPLRVQVRLSGAKVAFPKGDTRQVELTERTETVDFPVEARAAGSFPVEVLVETPDGALLIARGRLILRSSAVSAVALAAVGGSTLFLLLSWLRRERKRERRARARRSHPAGSRRANEPEPPVAPSAR